jgi:cytochrome oxidase Cu insertion factor (SCO1/SenC/PrrC family)
MKRCSPQESLFPSAGATGGRSNLHLQTTVSSLRRAPCNSRHSVSHTTTLYALDTSGRTRILFDDYAQADEIVNGILAILDAG